jgi:hypothetical protein
MPICFKSSPQVSLQLGSIASSAANCDLPPLTLPPDILWFWPGGRTKPGESGGVGWIVGADECLCPPKNPPSRPCRCPPPAACPKPPKAFDLVALLAFFSLSFIFFMNCLASFSSTKDNPARQSSVSNVWKYVLSWL